MSNLITVCIAWDAQLLAGEREGDGNSGADAHCIALPTTLS
jgi:hypothetical protein